MDDHTFKHEELEERLKAAELQLEELLESIEEPLEKPEDSDVLVIEGDYRQTIVHWITEADCSAIDSEENAKSAFVTAVEARDAGTEGDRIVAHGDLMIIHCDDSETLPCNWICFVAGVDRTDTYNVGFQGPAPEPGYAEPQPSTGDVSRELIVWNTCKGEVGDCSHDHEPNVTIPTVSAGSASVINPTSPIEVASKTPTKSAVTANVSIAADKVVTDVNTTPASVYLPSTGSPTTVPEVTGAKLVDPSTQANTHAYVLDSNYLTPVWEQSLEVCLNGSTCTLTVLATSKTCEGGYTAEPDGWFIKPVADPFNSAINSPQIKIPRDDIKLTGEGALDAVLDVDVATVQSSPTTIITAVTPVKAAVTATASIPPNKVVTDLQTESIPQFTSSSVAIAVVSGTTEVAGAKKGCAPGGGSP